MGADVLADEVDSSWAAGNYCSERLSIVITMTRPVERRDDPSRENHVNFQHCLIGFVKHFS